MESKLTKPELRKMIQDARNEILAIDEKSIYSLSYYFYNEGAKRQELVEKIKMLEMEILYIEDDEKFDKYRPMKSRDPLKSRPKKLGF
jgi:hypothetical protein